MIPEECPGCGILVMPVVKEADRRCPNCGQSFMET